MKVQGIVQGVGFRWHVKNCADQLGITGSVWNCHDRTVELIAFSETEEDLDALAEMIKRGPGRVSSLTETRSEGRPPTEFEIGLSR
jgi:acylphosphatase